MAIVKVTLTVTSAYTAAEAPPSSIDLSTWGAITLWDVRPWLPWDSRGLVGVGNWQDYLQRVAVMDSTQAPAYDPTAQGPKSWSLRTDTTIIYDTTVLSDPDPFTPVSRNGPGTSTTWTPTPDSPVAFDAASVSALLSTLVVAAYGYNGNTPVSTFPTGTDLLQLYEAYIDVELDDASVTRYRPTSAAVIDGGPVVRRGVPTDVLDAGNAVDSSASTFATVRETNGFFQEIFSYIGFSSLWHPAILLLEGWATPPPEPPPPRQVHSFYGIISTGRGRNVSFSS